MEFNFCHFYFISVQEQEFHGLLRDVRDAVISDSSASSLPISQFGLTIKSCSRSLELIKTITHCQHTSSESRTRQFRDLLESDSSGKDARISGGGGRFANASANSGVGAGAARNKGQGQRSNTLLARILCLGLGQGVMTERINSEQHISADARNMCTIYFAETGRTSFSRLPSHVLADEPLTRQAYETSLRQHIATWKLLSDHSTLKLHFDVIALLGSTAATNLTVQKFCLTNIVQNPKVIFQLMMIDKHEIRRAYLLLLRGIWFSNLPNSPSATETLTPDYKNYMLALFGTFLRDVRLYGFMKDDIAGYHDSTSSPHITTATSTTTFRGGGGGGAGGGETSAWSWLSSTKVNGGEASPRSPPHSSSNRSGDGGVQSSPHSSGLFAPAGRLSLSIDRSSAARGIQRFEGHALVLESYVMDALLPFVAHCVETKTLHVLDDVNFSGPGAGAGAGVSAGAGLGGQGGRGRPTGITGRSRGSFYAGDCPGAVGGGTLNPIGVPLTSPSPLLKRTASRRFSQSLQHVHHNPPHHSQHSPDRGRGPQLIDYFWDIALSLAREILGPADVSTTTAVLPPVMEALMKRSEAFTAARTIIAKALQEMLPANYSQNMNGLGRPPPNLHRASKAPLCRPTLLQRGGSAAAATTAVNDADRTMDKGKGGSPAKEGQGEKDKLRVEVKDDPDKLVVLKAALDALDAYSRDVYTDKQETVHAAGSSKGGVMQASTTSFATSIASLTAPERNIAQLTEEEQQQILKFNCLQEFIPTVDKFINAHGQRLDHLIFLKAPRFLYIGDREFLNDPEVLEDPTNSAGQGNLTKVDAVLNPLNSRFFKYTMQEMSKFVVSYARYNDPEGYDGIISQMQEVNNNRETEFKKISESDIILPDCHLDKDVSEMLSGMKQGKAELRNRVRSRKEIFSEAQFRRWSQHGGLLLRLLLEHILHSLACFRGENYMDRVSFSLDGINSCNAYWLSTLTKGVLKSKIAELFDLYSDQTETQIAQLAIETDRVMYIQNSFGSLNAHEVLVQMLGVSEENLLSSISACSIELLRRMAVDFGTALIQLGNPNLQNQIISTVDNDYNTKMSLGVSEHFMLSLRIMLQRYAHDFSSADELDPIRISQVRKLLTFISLLCEGHNETSQQYLGRFTVVLEVAAFIHDMSRLLAEEMKKSLIRGDNGEVDGLAPKYLPLVLGQYRRPLIRWVNPLPIHVADSRAVESSSKKAGRYRRRSLQPNTPTSPSPSLSPYANGKKVLSSGSAAAERRGSMGYRTQAQQQQQQQPTNFEFVNIDRLSLLCELVQAGYEALAEFCQRPCFANQVAIVRAGCTRDFHTFFEFFGAFQLVNKVTPAADDRSSARHAFTRRFAQEVKTVISHEAVHPLPSATRRTWIGNDPLAVFLMAEETVAVARGSSSIFHSHHRAQHKPPSPVSSRRGSLSGSRGGSGVEVKGILANEGQKAETGFNLTNLLFGCFSSRVQPEEERVMDLGSVESWIEEKALFKSYLDSAAHQTQRPGVESATAGIESNFYYKIRLFSKVLSNLEASCIKFTGRWVNRAAIFLFMNLPKNVYKYYFRFRHQIHLFLFFPCILWIVCWKGQ